MAVMSNEFVESGPARRRGPFRPGDYVQLSDVRGRMHTVVLSEDGFFQSHRVSIRHSEIIGKEEGTVVTSREGKQLLCVRPLLSDYVLSMPRGATIIYPKDAAQIIQFADIFPGATVLEAGLGSGALALSLLGAVGKEGHLISVERREDFAQIAKANVGLWFGQQPPQWQVEIGDFDAVAKALPNGSVDRIVLDMLAPWENLDAAHHALAPGGVLCCYVATVTQLSRLAEDIAASGRFTPVKAWETTVRDWHLEGLAVRPEHRMIGHTGFLLTTRALAPGSPVLEKKKRPAKEAEDQPGQWDHVEEWDEQSAGQRPISDKKSRRVVRHVTARAQKWVEPETEE